MASGGNISAFPWRSPDRSSRTDRASCSYSVREPCLMRCMPQMAGRCMAFDRTRHVAYSKREHRNEMLRPRSELVLIEDICVSIVYARAFDAHVTESSLTSPRRLALPSKRYDLLLYRGCSTRPHHRHEIQQAPASNAEPAADASRADATALYPTQKAQPVLLLRGGCNVGRTRWIECRPEQIRWRCSQARRHHQ